MNLFEFDKTQKNGEEIFIIYEDENVRIEKIISRGHTSGWYDQNEPEFVMLLEGGAELEYENKEKRKLKKGETVLIEAHKKHRVSYTSKEPPAIWLCVFSKK